jgi:short-subunit dehydrogenase
MSSPKSVVVTGASAGLGRAIALEFASKGWRVGLIARGKARLNDVRREVEEAGGVALVLAADVADASAVENCADRFASEWGSIDIWVNCAMATVLSPVSQMSPEEYRRVTEVTYLGYVHGTLAALKHMRQANRGTIVQIGSALAHRSIPWQSAYCAAKFAIRGFTDSLRSELIHEGSAISVTMVQCPAMNTPQFDWARYRLSQQPQPVPPIFQPEAVARAVYRAAHDRPRELWVGMPTLKAIVGNIIAPGWLDRMLARRATEGQLSGEPAPVEREDNLFEPVAGDFGARGRFGARSHDAVLSIDPHKARGALAIGGATLLLGGAALLLPRTKRRPPRRFPYRW